MPLKVVREDITNMKTQAVVNMADFQVAKGDEDKLRACYRNSLQQAKENKIKSIALPLIARGQYGYPKEEGMRIAVDEINAFLLDSWMDIYLVVPDEAPTGMSEKISPDLEEYIDQNYVEKKRGLFGALGMPLASPRMYAKDCMSVMAEPMAPMDDEICEEELDDFGTDDEAAFEELNKKLNERLAHKSDTFSEYLLYLIESKGMKNADVYNRAIVDKRYFSKIKNNVDFHPEKIKALCLCVGARLNIDETKDLLARAGYALSPADLTDIIFSFYIENEHFDVIDIDIQLEEHGLPCIIS